MRRVIGIDIHRTFGEVVIWDKGVLRHAGRVDMTRTALEGFGKSLQATVRVRRVSAHLTAAVTKSTAATTKSAFGGGKPDRDRLRGV